MTVWRELSSSQPALFGRVSDAALITLADDSTQAWTLEVRAQLGGVWVTLGALRALPGVSNRAVAVARMSGAEGYEVRGASSAVRGRPNRARVGLSSTFCTTAAPLSSFPGWSFLLDGLGSVYDAATPSQGGVVAGFPCALGTGEPRGWLRASAPASNAAPVYLVLADATIAPTSGAPLLPPVPVAPGATILLPEARRFSRGLSWVSSSSPSTITPVPASLLVSALVERRG